MDPGREMTPPPPPRGGGGGSVYADRRNLLDFDQKPDFFGACGALTLHDLAAIFKPSISQRGHDDNTGTFSIEDTLRRYYGLGCFYS